jgi:hypothetical protein
MMDIESRLQAARRPSCKTRCKVVSFLTKKHLGKNGVANGTRTRNIQNHNLGLYH